MNQFQLPSQFYDLLQLAVKKLRSWISSNEIIRVSSHIDADGLSAAGIICSALQRLNVSFHLRIFRQLDPEFIEKLANEKHTCHIFSDFGSGQMTHLSKLLSTKEIIILDHHEPINTPKPSNIIEINPHIFGIDGSNEISGAGAAFLFAHALDPSQNIDLLPLALVGAIGDTQDKGKQHSFTGLNAKIAEIGIQENQIKIEKDLYLQYRETKPIHHALMETTTPFLPGLTGNEEACVQFLQSIGLPLHAGENWRTISDLSNVEKRNLTTQLTQLILSHGGTSEQASSLVSTNYLLVHETEAHLKDAREFSELLNACGRTHNSGIGVAVCMGDRGPHYRRAQDLVVGYQKKINTFIESLRHPGKIRETEYVQYFYGGENLDETMIGTIATIAIKIQLANKVLIGLASADNNIYKISARAPKIWVDKGVHLGIALRQTISKLHLDPAQFLAGGHDAAAGTRIPIEQEQSFIETLNQILKIQISQKTPP